MLRTFITNFIHRLRRVITQPRSELDRWQRAIRFAYDLGRYGGRQLRRDRAPQMAAALAFRTLFALPPVLIVATILVKAVRGTESFLQLTGEMLSSLGLDKIQFEPPTQNASEAAGGSVSLAQWLEGLITEASSVNLSAVGWVGVAVIGYAAIGLMVTIENSFNSVYRAPEGRPWTRRIPLYWFILTVSPVAIWITWTLNSSVDQWIGSVDSWKTLLGAMGILWSLLVSWLLMYAVYSLIPNTSLAVRPALAGAFVAASLFEIGKHSLAAYLQNAFSISQLYGSLGLIPLFMFWVYLMWLAVLFGLEVSATLQMLGGRGLEEIEPKSAGRGLLDPASVVTVMEVVVERFTSGNPTNARQIAEQKSIPESVIALMLRHLVDRGILHRLEGDVEAVTLASPPEQVTADELIEIGFQIVDEGGLGGRSPLVEQLRDVQRQQAARTTLAALASPKS